MANNNDNKVLNVPPLRFPEFTGEWQLLRLGEIGKTYNGLTGKSGEDFGEGYPYITYKSIFDSSKIDISRVEYVNITEEELKKGGQNEVQYGDIFFTTSSETPEEVGMASVLLDKINHCYLNSFCFGYRLNQTNIHLPEFMRFYLRSQSIRRKLFILAQGSTRFNISKNEVMRMGIMLPHTTEQRKIAQLLTLIDEHIATQSKIIEDLEQLKSAIYHRVFSTIKGRTVALQSIANIVKGKQLNGTELSDNGDYYVMNGGIVPSGYYHEYNTPANTISISEGGNSCGYVQFNRKPFWSGGHCYALHIEHNEVNLHFLYHFLKYREKDIMALRIGSGLPNIQKKDLGNFPILLPDIYEQNKVVCLFETLQQKVDTETKVQKYLFVQKQYFLQQMFI